jgi:hypothetical protein
MDTPSLLDGLGEANRGLGRLCDSRFGPTLRSFRECADSLGRRRRRTEP